MKPLGVEAPTSVHDTASASLTLPCWIRARARPLRGSLGFAAMDARFLLTLDLARRPWRCKAFTGYSIRMCGALAISIGAARSVGAVDADHADHAVLGLHDLDRDAVDAQRQVRLRDLLQVFEDQAVERLRAVEWQIDAEAAVQFAQVLAAVDERRAVLVPFDAGMGLGLAGGELADDLLDDVVHG